MCLNNNEIKDAKKYIQERKNSESQSEQKFFIWNQRTGYGKQLCFQMYVTANDPRPKMIPTPQVIPIVVCVFTKSVTEYSECQRFFWCGFQFL